VILWGLLERGRYGKYIAQLFEYFPRAQVRRIVFERFVEDQVREFAQVAVWLGLPPAEIAPAYENPTGRPALPWMPALCTMRNCARCDAP
jgi:hypothetical protein